MARNEPFATPITPDWEALVRCIRREGTPARVHHIELFLDPEVQDVANYIPLDNYLAMLDEGRKFSL